MELVRYARQLTEIFFYPSFPEWREYKAQPILLNLRRKFARKFLTTGIDHVLRRKDNRKCGFAAPLSTTFARTS